MDKSERISDYLDESLDLNMVNEYRYKNRLSTVYDMDNFNDELDCYDPKDIADMVYNGDYDPDAEYFTYDDDSITTYYSLEFVVDISVIVDYIIENDEDFGDPQIRSILDDDGEEKTIIIHINDEAQEFRKDTFESLFGGSNNRFYNSDKSKMLTVDDVLLLMDDIEDGEEEGQELWLFDVCQLIMDKGMDNRAMILDYYGYVFDSHRYYNGMPFYWFYVPEKRYLMRLFYDSPIDLANSNEVNNPMFIQVDKYATELELLRYVEQA